MTRKIIVESLNEINMIYKEDSLIVKLLESNEKTQKLPLSLSVNYYKKGEIILIAPEKAKIIKEGESTTPDPYSIKLNNIIVFDDSNGLNIVIKNNNNDNNQYFLINKKDILFILND